MVDTFSCELFSSPCWVEKDRVPPLTGCSHPPKMNLHREGGCRENINFASNAPCKSRFTIDLRDIVCSRDDDQERHRYRRCLDCAETPPQPPCSCASSEDDAGPRPDLSRRSLTGGVKFAYKAAAAPGRRRSRCSGGGGGDVWWRRLWLVAAVCLVLGLDTCAAHMMPQTDLSTHREKGVCQSVDVRNDVQAFQRLSGCRVVEGFVQILLIDRADEAAYDNVTFPELREITDYLLLYRVNGLRSVGKLFPNLAVIRGNTLFFNYAFISFEMIHLQEIGLQSLTDILRGGVRIEKNPLLCFVNTVDWDHIAKASKGEHYIKGNRQKNECPMCPTLSPLCPQAPGSKDYLCWNNNYCQKVCTNCGDRTCSANGHDCCHESCLGGCSRANSSEDCTVCKGVLFQKKCIKSCPVNTYRYLNRRCILEQECLDMPVPREQVNDYRDKPWKAFNNTCILDCPHGYMEMKSFDGRRYQCEPCKGPCRKECAGVNVDSIASAQKLRGCTYIKGSLEIQIRGGKNIVKELEENLNMIEEIEGYLKIVRSFPLVSLNFIKNLKVIHGKELESHKYVFVVLDNQNLQELWDWSTRHANLQINRGRLFFHFNPKLCLYKIERLKHVANFSEFSDLDVARNSNGDKVACNVTALKVDVTQTRSQAVILMWSQFDHYDPRSLLGYVVYSTEAPYQNVTLYDGRDACGADGWKVDDVHVPENQSALVYHLLSRLKPYTQYAFYVKTYTIATERTGAQSPIYYFRTNPDIPSVPMSLQVFSNSSSSMVVTWQPPTEPNGNITHYIVSGSWEKDDPKFLSQRNYCFDPLTLPEKKPTFIFPEKTQEKKTEEETCSCEEKTEPNTKSETEVLSQIDFEDTLHNIIYIKRPPQNRSKREVLGGDLQLMSKEHKEEKALDDKLSMELTKENGVPNKIVNGIYESFEIQVNGTNMYVVTNLSHFAEYTIAVQACRELVPSDNGSVITCSAKSIFTSRTQALPGADNIDPKHLVLEVSNQTLATEVKLKWMEPPTPNGIIVTYHIMYTPVDNGDMKPQIECIPASEFQKSHKEYLLKRVAPGNYSIQVRATSLAGHGQYTPKRYIYIQDPSTPSGQDVWIGVLVGGGFVVLIIFGTIFFMRRNYKGVPNMKLIASVNPEYVNTVYVPDEWEVSRKKVEMLRELGQGSFGMVYEGIGHDIVEGQPTIRCAIKTVNEHATDRERSEFLNEASVMKAFNTHHVVRLLGVVSQGQPVLVIMELMPFGDLKSYLRSHRPDVSDDPTIHPPTLKRILQMAIEIADGMAYLSAKKFVHRDLAARNCMVAEDLTVKIGDFGMTRDIYETDYYRKGTKGLLPVRWMAPESLKDGVFTSFSDVWSYGVVLWEMATLASQPYQGLSNDQVLRYVIEGGVMERPENCPDKLYELMRQCWQHKTTLRPPFMELVSQLLTDISSNFAQVSFYHSTAGQEVRTQYAITMAPTSDDPSTPLRMTHDIEDFSLGGSDADEDELDQEEEDDTPVPPTQLNPHYHSMSATQSQPSKMGNGSAVTTPTAPNGWISNNGSGAAAPANPIILMKTTEC